MKFIHLWRHRPSALALAIGALVTQVHATGPEPIPDWETLNIAQPPGKATIGWDIWWGSADYTSACYQVAGQAAGCVARNGAATSPLQLDAQRNALATRPGEASKGVFHIPASVHPAVASAPVVVTLYGSGSQPVASTSFTMTFGSAPVASTSSTSASASASASSVAGTPAPASSAVPIVPDWNTLNLAQSRTDTTIAWDIWWGSADYAKACYQISGKSAGCVARTGTSFWPLPTDAQGQALAVVVGQASKGLFHIPATSIPATAATAPATITLYGVNDAVLGTASLTLKFASSASSAGTSAAAVPQVLASSKSSSSIPAATAATPPTVAPTSPADAAPPARYTVTRAQLDAIETRLTSGPVITAIKQAIKTLPNDQVEAIVPGRGANPVNVRRVERLLSAADWEYLFPLRAPEYTYTGFLRAIGKFPAVCRDYTDQRDADAICRKAMATMFAHFAQETGAHESWRPELQWRQALHWVREMGWTETMRGGYNAECAPTTWQGQTWPCGTFADGTFKSYFGRGAKQLSYNYNYGPFSLAMYGSVRPLMDKPELVADTWLNLASAVFFYMYPQPPKPPMMFVVDGTWQPNARDLANGLKPGFGVTTQIINGGVECGGSVEVAQSLNRIDYYRSFAQFFGVPVPADEVMGCKGMKQFDEGGSGATPIYWERDDSWVAANPGGKTYACKLVGYQTPYSALTAGDYTACVKANFPDIVISP